MGINLEKNSSINLTKAEPSLRHLHIGLGWDAVDANGNEIDCDVSVFMLNESGKIPGDGFFVFYNNHLVHLEHCEALKTDQIFD